MNQRVLLIHDGSTIADKAIEEAIRLALDLSVQLHFLAVVHGDENSNDLNGTTRDPNSSDDAFVRLQDRYLTTLTGDTVRNATVSQLLSFVQANDVCHVVLSSDQLEDANSHTARLLIAFSKKCKVPVSSVP